MYGKHRKHRVQEEGYVAMSNSLDIDMPPREATPGNAHDPTALRVDQVIAHLFPAPTLGQLFLARFRERAARERSILPDEPEDTAIILTRSIATLAKELDLSNDTTQKYVVIFKALGLLRKRKLMGQLAFVIDTGIYHPPETLEANLDYLLVHYQRPKLRDMAQQVKERCLLYGLISQDVLTSLRQLQTMLQPRGKRESRRAFEQQLLHAQHLVVQIIHTLQSSRLPKGRSSIDETWNLPPVEHAVESTREESTQDRASGRRERDRTTTNLSKLPHQGDSTPHQWTEESIQTITSSRFEQEIPATRLSRISHQGDSPVASANKRVIESTHFAREGRREDGDSPSNLPADTQQVDSSSLTNVNVSICNVIASLNVNVSPVAEYLCWIFKETPTKRGYYYNLYKEHPQPDAWLAAAIETLIGLHQAKTIRIPGKYFYDRCVAFHQTGIPPDTAVLVQRYGSLTYPQLLEALQHSSPTKSRPPFHQISTRGQASPIKLRLPRDKLHPGMSRKDLRNLLTLMDGDVRTCELLVLPYLQADGSCALLVDDGMGHQRWVYALCDWQEDCSRMRTTLDLFSHDQTSPRILYKCRQ